MYLLSADDETEREEKFLLLYNEYRAMVYYSALHVLQDSYLAEDAVQEVFLKFTRIDVMDKIDEIDSPRARAYIKVLTKHVVYNMFNKRKRYRAIFIQDEIEAVARLCVMEDNTEQVLEKFSLEELTATIKKLPHHYVTILILKYVRQFSDKEVAVLLDIKEATARKRLERARKLLKTQYLKDFSICEVP